MTVGRPHPLHHRHRLDLGLFFAVFFSSQPQTALLPSLNEPQTNPRPASLRSKLNRNQLQATPDCHRINSNRQPQVRASRKPTPPARPTRPKSKTPQAVLPQLFFFLSLFPQQHSLFLLFGRRNVHKPKKGPPPPAASFLRRELLNLLRPSNLSLGSNRQHFARSKRARFQGCFLRNNAKQKTEGEKHTTSTTQNKLGAIEFR